MTMISSLGRIECIDVGCREALDVQPGGALDAAERAGWGTWFLYEHGRVWACPKHAPAWSLSTGWGRSAWQRAKKR